MPRAKALLAISLATLSLLVTRARSDDWTTVGSDAQRSSWVRSDIKITPAAVRSAEFQFLWRMPLAYEPRSGRAASVPVLLDFLISHRGFRSLAFVGDSSGGVFAMDTDLARMEWERQFSSRSSASSTDCPGGMTANLTRPTAAAMPSAIGFTARGRRSPANSGVGLPGEGAVTLAAAVGSRSAAVRPPSGGRTRPPAQRALRGVTLVYALSADGKLHSLYVSNGRNRAAPIAFLPANAKAAGLIVVDGTAYVTTSNQCGGATDGVWALDLESGSVATWESPGGGVAGLAGAAFGPDGTVYVTTDTGPLAALEAASLRQSDASPPVGFRSSPVVFDVSGKDHVAALARDGSLQVFAADSLGIAIASAPEAAKGAQATALASWQDPTGGRWLLVPAGDALASWKLVTEGGSARLEQAWESLAMADPLPPIVVNGIVFALDGGGDSRSAKLYAFDGMSGERIWDSGDSIESSARGHVLSSGPGHVYLTASDSAVYAFGIPMEH